MSIDPERYQGITVAPRRYEPILPVTYIAAVVGVVAVTGLWAMILYEIYKVISK